MKYIAILLVAFMPLISNAQVMTSAEWHVKEYYADAPDLVRIAFCESTYRQFDADGSVLQGKVNKDDIGIMQINRFYHEKTATALGFDIYTMEGNLGYARYLYEKYGTAPWINSKKCWD